LQFFSLKDLFRLGNPAFVCWMYKISISNYMQVRISLH